METEKIFDGSDVLDRVEGDVDFLKELTQEFLQSFPQQLEELSASVDHQNLPEVERKAHSLKGALRNLGAVRSGAVAYSIENGARSGELTAMQTLLGKLQESVQEFEVELNKFLRQKENS